MKLSWDLLHIPSHDLTKHKTALANATAKFWQIWIDGYLDMTATDSALVYSAVLYKPSGQATDWVNPIYK